MYTYVYITMARNFDSYNCDFILPSLYSITKIGKKMIWRVGVSGNTVVREWGYINNKMQCSTRDVFGVNKGRKNESTDVDQAISIARQEWVARCDKGYLPEDEGGLKLLREVKDHKGRAGGTNRNVSTLMAGKEGRKITVSEDANVVKSVDKEIVPMKGSPWTPHKPVHLDFDNGVWIQPKLDGVRCVAWVSNGNAIMVTSGGNQFVFLTHIKDELKKLLKDKNVVLDGEMYAHNLVDEDGNEIDRSALFGLITGACRSVSKRPDKYEAQMKYCVFDIYDETGVLDQDERFDLLESLFEGYKSAAIIKVERKLVNNIDHVFDIHKKYEKDGYEGVMLRDRRLKYESKRSKFMKKFKSFEDEECLIVGYDCAKGGRENGSVVWKCVWSNGKKFDVRPRGTLEDRKKLYKDAEKYVGKKMITVVYQELSKDGVPRFPVAKEGFRDYE